MRRGRIKPGRFHFGECEMNVNTFNYRVRSIKDPKSFQRPLRDQIDNRCYKYGS